MTKQGPTPRPHTTPRPPLDMSEFDLPRGSYQAGQSGGFPLYAYEVEPMDSDFPFED